MVGPLYGAVVLAVSRVAGDLRAQPRGRPGARGRPALGWARRRARRRPTGPAGVLLACSPWSRCVLTMVQPTPSPAHVTLGLGFVPVAGDSRWLAPGGHRGARARRRAAGALPDRERAAGRRARLGVGGPRGRPARRRPAGRRAGRGDPGVRHRRPRGGGALPRRAPGCCSASAAAGCCLLAARHAARPSRWSPAVRSRPGRPGVRWRSASSSAPR